MNIQKLNEQLLLHEGFRSRPYQDSVGKWTIGIGRNVEDNPITPSERGHLFGNPDMGDDELWEALLGGISRQQAFILLESDIREALRYIRRLSPNFEALSEPRKFVLIDMLFNLGYGTMRRSFLHIIDLIEAGDYRGAVEAIQRTKYAKQVGHRDNRLCVMLLRDVYHDQVSQREILDIEAGRY